VFHVQRELEAPMQTAGYAVKSNKSLPFMTHQTPEPKTHPITIRVSTKMLNEIDSRTPDRRRVCRERFVMDAVEAYLGHPENVVYDPPQ
jgi:hypothetical protein